MTMIWRMAVALVVVALVTAVRPACVFACECRPPGPPATALADATAVFSGRVMAFSAPVDRGGPHPADVTFTRTRTSKGAEESTIVIRTPASSASCGVDFVEGQEYLVYARESEGWLETTLCSRTTQIALAGEDLAMLGAGSAPALPAGGAEAPAALPATGALSGYRLYPVIVGGALLVILLGALLVNRRRSPL